MKKSTKQILCWLYQPDSDRPRQVTEVELEWWLEDLTVSGRASVLRYLVQQQYLAKDLQVNSVSYRLTNRGEEALKAALPALSVIEDEIASEWHCLVFISPPKQDPQFRYLRTLIINQGGQALSRGVFLFPGELPAQIKTICHQLYPGSVVVFGISEWKIGDKWSIVSEQYHFSDTLSLYSGISSQLNQLLRIEHSQKSLIDQRKSHFKKLFIDFLSLLDETPGIFWQFNHHVPSPKELLDHFQTFHP